MGVPDPTLDRVTDQSVLEAITGVLGLASIEGAYRASCGGNKHLLVPTRQDVAQVTVDPRAVAQLCAAAGMNTLSPFCWDASEVRQRVFAPRMGITESPAAGTAAVPAAVYARESWGAGADVCVRQGHAIGRPSLITVHMQGTSISVTGSVRQFARGTFTLAGRG
jgi:PhzF family phenazine biosynthesis protein